jgi:hypothetical protein
MSSLFKKLKPFVNWSLASSNTLLHSCAILRFLSVCVKWLSLKTTSCFFLRYLNIPLLWFFPVLVEDQIICIWQSVTQIFFFSLLPKSKWLHITLNHCSIADTGNKKGRFSDDYEDVHLVNGTCLMKKNCWVYCHKGVEMCTWDMYRPKINYMKIGNFTVPYLLLVPTVGAGRHLWATEERGGRVEDKEDRRTRSFFNMKFWETHHSHREDAAKLQISRVLSINEPVGWRERKVRIFELASFYLLLFTTFKGTVQRDFNFVFWHILIVPVYW